MIARIAYSRESNVNRLRYNDSLIETQWVRNKPQTFELLVDMRRPTAPTTKLLIINDLYTNPTESTPLTKPFLTPTAGNLAMVRAQFSGLDSGIMAWDDITITQLPDDAQ